MSIDSADLFRIGIISEAGGRRRVEDRVESEVETEVGVRLNPYSPCKATARRPTMRPTTQTDLNRGEAVISSLHYALRDEPGCRRGSSSPVRHVQLRTLPRNCWPASGRPRNPRNSSPRLPPSACPRRLNLPSTPCHRPRSDLSTLGHFCPPPLGSFYQFASLNSIPSKLLSIFLNPRSPLVFLN